MYVIRVRSGNGPDRIEAEFSGQMSTAEAMRAVSQGFALAHAGGLTSILADVRSIESGPDALEIIAVAMSLHMTPNFRCALLCQSSQVKLARRFARGTRLGRQLAIFTSETSADGWLDVVPEQRLGLTEQLHVRRVDSASSDAPAAKRRQSATG
jgi:hypothetical protein